MLEVSNREGRSQMQATKTPEQRRQEMGVRPDKPAQRTPGPWRLSGAGLRVEGPSFQPIANAYWYKSSSMRTVTEINAENEANLRYIVRACNAHDDLVAALRKAARVIEGHLNGSREPCVGDLTDACAALKRAEEA